PRQGRRARRGAQRERGAPVSQGDPLHRAALDGADRRLDVRAVGHNRGRLRPGVVAMTSRRGFVLPMIILLIFAGSLVIAAALERYSTQQLIVEQQIEGYRRHHDVQGARAVLKLWIERQGIGSLAGKASPEAPAHRFELPGGRRIQVYLLDGQGLVKADVSGEERAMRDAYETFQRRLPPDRHDLYRRLGPPQVSVNSAPEDVLAALAPDGRDLAPVLLVARETERLNQASTRVLLTDFGYDNEQIAEIFRLL